jgi:hypothetical protein
MKTIDFKTDEDLTDLIINFDPERPQPRFFATASAMATALTSFPSPTTLPWPAGLAPAPKTIHPKPSPTHALPKCDYIIVTWTAAEAAMLAQIMTPGVMVKDWYLYGHNADQFAAKIVGGRAPFNDKQSRFFHMLGGYYMSTIGGSDVICFKSNLHVSTDGSKLPLLDLWGQILDEVKPKLIITTGTGGGVGSNILLGDVVVAKETIFDLLGHFKNEPYAHQGLNCNNGPMSFMPLVENSLVEPNAARLRPVRPAGAPKVYYPGSSIADPKIVTTDIFAFDDTTNSFNLQGLGNMVEMDDATLGLVLKTRGDTTTKWAAIRNASDPQMDGTVPAPQRKKDAASIYLKYGYWTTIGSVAASWAAVAGELGHAPPAMAAVTMAQSPVSAPKAIPISGRDALLDMALDPGLKIADLATADVPPEALGALKKALAAVNVSYDTSDISFRDITFKDGFDTVNRLILASVSNTDAEEFLGDYMIDSETIIEKREFVTS